MNLTKNFTLEELTASSTADAKGISNVPDGTVKVHLTELAQMLQSIRDYYGKAIRVSSGYRCPAVNKAVGGAVSSQHMTGYAADIKPMDGNMTDLQMCVLTWAKNHQYDQIILEQPTNGIAQWIHVGVKHVQKGQRRQKLVARKVGGRWTYELYGK